MPQKKLRIAPSSVACCRLNSHPYYQRKEVARKPVRLSPATEALIKRLGLSMAA